MVKKAKSTGKPRAARASAGTKAKSASSPKSKALDPKEVVFSREAVQGDLGFVMDVPGQVFVRLRDGTEKIVMKKD